jgi:hypothetical protein
MTKYVWKYVSNQIRLIIQETIKYLENRNISK